VKARTGLRSGNPTFGFVYLAATIETMTTALSPCDARSPKHSISPRSGFARLVVGATLILSAAPAARAAPEIGRPLTPDEVRSELEKLAGEIAFWPIWAIIYDRDQDIGEWASEAEWLPK